MKFRSLCPLVVGATLSALATTPLVARPHNGLWQHEWLMNQLINFSNVPDSIYSNVINNTSALSYVATGTLPVMTSVNEVSAIIRQLDMPYTNTMLGENRPAWQTYAIGQWSTGDFDNDPTRPIYNPESWGGLVGAQYWADEERLVGGTLSYNFSRANIHHNGGRIDNDNIRARLYAALVPEEQPWWAIIGVSGAYNYYDARRNLPLSSEEVTTSNPEGYEVGVFAAVNARLRITEGLQLTPFARIDYNYVHTNKFTEKSNVADPDSFRLRVKRFNTESIQTRLGSGLEYTKNFGAATLQCAISAAWVSELGGNDIEIRSELVNVPFYTKIDGDQMFGDGVEFIPTVALVFDNGLMLQASYTVFMTFEAQFTQNVSVGVGYRF
ncbi:MAG: autotransporter outer membrane beta-barrel domain-containing protein [Puniceicoccales bacterium]|nr:autotransporter outer membrane beta-barrel domain-containing protein [Puniceicoccales bacterium]